MNQNRYTLKPLWLSLLMWVVWALGWWCLSQLLQVVGHMPPPLQPAYPPELVWRVVLLSPLAEEALFRGIGWQVISRLLRNNPWQVGMVTGLIFAGCHGGYLGHPVSLTYIVWSTVILTVCRGAGGTWIASWFCHTLINTSFWLSTVAFPNR